MIYTVILNNSLSEKDGKANNLGCAYKCDAAADDADCSLNANARPCRHTQTYQQPTAVPQWCCSWQDYK